MKVSMLTTIDNPFDPFEEFELWSQFDNANDYFCCNYLARIAKTSDSFTEQQNAEEIERAIDEIIATNPLKIYKKVSREIDETELYRS